MKIENLRKGSICAKQVFSITRIGTASTAPITPHIHPQKTMERKTTAAFSV